MRACIVVSATLIVCGGFGGCSSSTAAPADGARRDGSVAGENGGAGDGPRREASSPGDDSQVSKPDLPPAPTHWQAVPGTVQPQVIDHAAVRLQNGDVLIAGGDRPVNTGAGSWDFAVVDDTYRYVASKDSFEAAGKLQVARCYATATALDDGRVLVVGGESDAAYGETAVDIYDPAKGTWTKAAPLPKGREGHTAVRLDDGKVLVGGGCWFDTTLNSFVLYDPQANSWSTLGPTMNQQRCFHTMTALPGGKLLIAGGFQGPQNSRVWLDSLEVFDPKTGSDSVVAAKMVNPRAAHSADRLPDGRVLIVGGWCGPSCTTWNTKSDIYDPITDKITSIADDGDDSPYLAAHAVTADGRVLLAGDYGTPQRAIAFSAAAGGSWTALPDLLNPRYSAEAVLLGDGSILVVGGRDDAAGGMPTMPPAERFVH